MGIEVEVPSCAQVMSADANQANVIAAGGNGCTPSVLTINNMGDKPTSYDDELKILTNGLTPEFSRKDKTADGWVFVYKLNESGDTTPHQHVIAQFKSIQCVADSLKADEAATDAHACASMRASK